MDALLLALLGCLACELGDRSQLLALALSTRYRRTGAVLAGLGVAAIANAALSAAAGGLLSPMIPPDARLLFLAIATLFAGVAMLMPARMPDTLSGWRTGPFLTSALGLFILGFGEASPFLIGAIAARAADPVMAGIGGAAGIMAAGAPVVLLRGGYFAALPLRAIRRASGLLCLAIACWLAAEALHLP
ncbi:TMEM165/GDT1 family protein [Sphingobium aquiterrae]|uniref:TMEM165/GDT1 family protein n=1 Tax=Sphingobium aquiterrae TaxID=2038656 RepID=UPI00301AAA59